MSIKVTGAKQVKSGDEQDLKLAVYTQPVVAAIDASHASFQLYRSGVYYEPACSPWRLDHAILVVGYGSQAGKDFWIVKNSWGMSLIIPINDGIQNLNPSFGPFSLQNERYRYANFNVSTCLYFLRLIEYISTSLRLSYHVV